MARHTTKEELAMAREWLVDRYNDQCAEFPMFSRDVSEVEYCRANINAVLTFDRRMQLISVPMVRSKEFAQNARKFSLSYSEIVTVCRI